MERRCCRGFRGGLIALALVLTGTGTAWADCNRAGGQAGPPTVVHFDTDSTAIKGQFQAELTKLVERHRGNPNMKVCIIGQADKQGDDAYNEKLALKRANAVAAYLEKQGLPRQQFDISARGEAFGDTLFGNDAAESDRRVEVMIVRF
ncbi:MAG: OmpA family protein [Kiloniellales bacterium]|nr:OmpA family protein [Kiloniellales bacterium]